MTAVDAPMRNHYGFSVLLTALARMWRGWRVTVPVIAVNAAVQSLLLLPGTLPYLSPWFVVLAALSLLALIGSYALVAAAMLAAATGAVDAAHVMAVARQRFWPIVAWSLGLLVVVTLGLAAWIVPGLVVLALTPYVLLAVADGQRNPIRVNLATIRARWGRWLVTVALTAVLCLGMWLFAAINGFFVTGAPAAFIAWLAFGLMATWLTCAWALVYRSVHH